MKQKMYLKIDFLQYKTKIHKNGKKTQKKEEIYIILHVSKIKIFKTDIN